MYEIIGEDFHNDFDSIEKNHCLTTDELKWDTDSSTSWACNQIAGPTCSCVFEIQEPCVGVRVEEWEILGT